jgi:hypothetical protein
VKTLVTLMTLAGAGPDDAQGNQTFQNPDRDFQREYFYSRKLLRLVETLASNLGLAPTPSLAELGPSKGAAAVVCLSGLRRSTHKNLVHCEQLHTRFLTGEANVLFLEMAANQLI